ncbi:response regulator [Arenibaculum pallidiluteum]|uniref:response regulator n=1 Tax=Arenibaculum pallidiluteum TaxID=2812559 RepID=UPI001A96DC14|nr:response regulator [Arenibaculum pallidiluteum]
MSLSHTKLQGKRILAVEDELLVCMDLEAILEGAGCVVIGPAANLDQALDLARSESIDAAVLDVNLDGRPVFPAAEILRERQVPFVFASGYGGELSVPELLRGVPRVAKPYSDDAILAALSQAIHGA